FSRGKNTEILRFAQNDKRRAQNDKRRACPERSEGLGIKAFRSVFHPYQATASVRMPLRFAAAHRLRAARESLLLPSAERRLTRFLVLAVFLWFEDGVEARFPSIDPLARTMLSMAGRNRSRTAATALPLS